jgi:hypothetical protein
MLLDLLIWQMRSAGVGATLRSAIEEVNPPRCGDTEPRASLWRWPVVEGSADAANNIALRCRPGWTAGDRRRTPTPAWTGSTSSPGREPLAGKALAPQRVAQPPEHRCSSYMASVVSSPSSVNSMTVARRSVGWGCRRTNPSSSRASTSAVTLRRVTPSSSLMLLMIWEPPQCNAPSNLIRA